MGAIYELGARAPRTMIELPVKMAAPGITDAPATVRRWSLLPYTLVGRQFFRGYSLDWASGDGVDYFTFTTDGRYVLGLGVRDQSINLLAYVEDAHPAIISKREFRRVKRLLGSRAPKLANPRRASSLYLLSGILKCETCGRAMSASEAGEHRGGA